MFFHFKKLIYPNAYTIKLMSILVKHPSLKLFIVYSLLLFILVLFMFILYNAKFIIVFADVEKYILFCALITLTSQIGKFYFELIVIIVNILS